jgi:hypothetical protein
VAFRREREEVPVSSRLEENKRNVDAFYDLMSNQRKPGRWDVFRRVPGASANNARF